MRRVLHVIDSLDLGGAQTALLNLLKYRDRGQFHHEVAAMHGEGMYAAAFRGIGVPVHSLSPGRFPPAYLVNLPKLLRAGRFDIAQFHLFGANWIAKPLAALLGVRCRIHHDQCNDAFRTDSKLVTAFDTLTNRLSTRILAVSRSVERFNTGVERIPADRVTYLPNGVDLGEFHPPTPQQRAEARERFGLSGFVFGGVGRHTPQKNFGLLLNAAKPLLRRRSELSVALFGSGPEEATLRRAAEGSAVRFLGTVPDRAAIYHSIDALVLPSRFEGLPLTVLEAMASGVPVIASAVDGVREVAVEGETALMPESGDEAGFRHAMTHVADGAALRERLAENARKLVEQKFDARVLARQLEEIYVRDLEKLGIR